MTSYNRLLITAWLLNLYDAGITVYATTNLLSTELNPLMRLCLDKDPLVFVAMKLLVMTLVCLITRRRFDEHPKKMWATLGFILALFVGVCVWNTLVVVIMLFA